MENNWKYIVYKTINLVNNKIYIGLHKTKNPEIFDGYLGNGIYNTQPYTYEHAKTAFQCAVKKYGPKNFRRYTIAIFNTAEEASDLEEQLVNEKFLERSDVYNMVLGGLGGYFISNRLKVYQYDLNGNYVNEYESYADAALKLNCDYTLISYAVRKRSIAKKYLWSNDKLEKIDLSQYNLGLNHAINIFVYNINGKYLGGYKTLTDAARKLKSTQGTLKKYAMLGSCFRNKFYLSFVKEDTYDKAKSKYLKIRPVYQYDINGNFVKAFDSQLEAELTYKTNITKSIRLKQCDELGYMWGLEKLTIYNKPNKRIKRKVGKFTLDNVLVKEYESATQAANENGTSVWKVLAGTNQTHKQHIYKYLDS